MLIDACAEPALQPPRPRGRRGGAGVDGVDGVDGLDRVERPRREVIPRFDAAGLLRRARRNARMSQRAMADAVGVGKSTIGQAERDGGSVTLPVLLAALAVGGIDLVAVDGDGEVETMRLDELRDRRHRKLPAHLYAWVPSEAEFVPEGWQGSSRRNAPVRWSLSPSQEDLAYLPRQHPGPDDLATVRRRDADLRAFRHARLAALRRPIPSRTFPLPECTCSDECVQLGMACPPACPCQCEAPARWTG